MIYLDTSVLAPLYWVEALSTRVEQFVNSETELALSQLIEVELVSALSRRVRMGEISYDNAKIISAKFETDLDRGVYNLIAVNNAHYDLAREWISRFQTPLRTLDALHLAIAHLNNITLVTADQGLAASAGILGAAVQLL